MIVITTSSSIKVTAECNEAWSWAVEDLTWADPPSQSLIPSQPSAFRAGLLAIGPCAAHRQRTNGPSALSARSPRTYTLHPATFRISHLTTRAHAPIHQ
jgi:hypothetical protein